MKKYVIIIMVIAVLMTGCTNAENKSDFDDNNQTNDINQNNNNGMTENQDDNKEIENINNEEDVELEEEKNQVSFYLFYSNSCQHCHAEREWIASIEDDYPYVDFKLYEASENQELLDKINKAYGVENDSVPITVIGNDYLVGYSDTSNRKFIRYIEDLATFDNCDVVDTIINNGDVEACMQQNEKK